MSKLILTLGICSLALGLAPFTLPKHEPVTKELRIHSVLHYKCDAECSLVDKEY